MPEAAGEGKEQKLEDSKPAQAEPEVAVEAKEASEAVEGASNEENSTNWATPVDDVEPEVETYKRATVRPAGAPKNLFTRKLNTQPAEEKPAEPEPEVKDPEREVFIQQRINAIKLQEQRYLDLTTKELASQASSILDINLKEMKENANKEFEYEKQKHIDALEKHKADLERDAELRVFSMIDGEVKEIN